MYPFCTFRAPPLSYHFQSHISLSLSLSLPLLLLQNLPHLHLTFIYSISSSIISDEYPHSCRQYFSPISSSLFFCKQFFISSFLFLGRQKEFLKYTHRVPNYAICHSPTSVHVCWFIKSAFHSWFECSDCPLVSLSLAFPTFPVPISMVCFIHLWSYHPHFFNFFGLDFTFLDLMFFIFELIVSPLTHYLSFSCFY